MRYNAPTYSTPVKIWAIAVLPIFVVLLLVAKPLAIVLAVVNILIVAWHRLT